MKLDERVTAARTDLDELFKEVDAPPVTTVSARARKRRVVQGVLASAALIAVTVGVVTVVTREDEQNNSVVVTPPKTAVPPAEQPRTTYAVRNNGVLVEIDVETRAVVREVARASDSNTIVDVTVGSDGIVYYQECCEPFIGVVHRAENDWDGSVYAVFGSGFAVSPDGTRLAASRPDFISIYEADSGRDIRHVPPLGATRTDLAWSPDGTQLAGVIPLSDGVPVAVVAVIDVEADEPVWVPLATGSDGRYSDPVYLADGRLLVATTNAQGATSLVAFGDGQRELVAGADFEVADLAVDPSTTRILAVGTDGVLRYLDRNGDWTVIGAGYVAADW